MKTGELKQIVCPVCGFTFRRGDLTRECSNCFACTGCEIYLCPECGNEIVVKPVGKPGAGNQAGTV